MTDQQHAQLATLAVGDTAVLVDEVPVDGLNEEQLVLLRGGEWFYPDPPHGMEGDEFTATIRDESLSPGDWHGQSYEGTFRVKSVEVKRSGDYAPHSFRSDIHPDTHLWLTEVERLQ